MEIISEQPALDIMCEEVPTIEKNWKFIDDLCKAAQLLIENLT